MRQTREQMLQKMEENISHLEGTARIGTVTKVYKADRTVRVSWADGTQSGSMKVLKNGEDWLPEVGDIVVSLHRASGDGWVLGSL